MPRVTKICKACGKEYEACRTPNPGVFRWRDIACSVECAEKYIHDVMVARGEIVEDNSEPAQQAPQSAAVPEEDPIEEPDENTIAE